MQRFAQLLDNLVYTQSRNRKLDLLGAYFRDTPDPDRGWALAALTGGLPIRFPLRRILGDILTDIIDPDLYKMSRDYVGDTAETVSLLWPDQPGTRAPPSLSDVVTTFSTTSPNAQAPILKGMLNELDTSGRFALLKLLGGAPRVGVSARLAKQSLAKAFATDINDIEELWHAVDPPFEDLFAWLEGTAPRPDPGLKPVFRPLMLAHPIEDEDWPNLNPGDIAAEWKWDGIRIQVAAKPTDVRIYSRTGDEITNSFPEIASAFTGLDCVVDGELLIMRDGVIAPFNDLQQRLNRKTVSAKMQRDYPAHVRLYDLLIEDGTDLRKLSFVERRTRLETWIALATPPRTDVSDLVTFRDFEHLQQIWEATRADEIEGLMLKQKHSPYLAGRPKGHWWKWKRAPLTIDCVMMYAQRGSGKRSSFYSDYTFGVWKDGTPEDPALGELVPVGKAYSGFTDEELTRLDKFIRNNTTDRFGPVRAVKPELVLEIAFDAVQPSPRHKSGIAMRFPRIARIRWDKPAEDADTLEAIAALLPQKTSP
ncbi:MAG: cisplatin damage response ATP-dependent DNA ligase [Pseudomonadota bacterium]